MNRISRNISIALRAERMIAQRRMAVIRRQTGLMAAAGLVAGIGLIMLNVAGYQALIVRMQPYSAALVVAAVNILLAVILAAYAGRINADEDVKGAAEVRDMAIEDLEAEVDGATREVRAVVDDLRKMVKNPLGTAMPGIISALAGALLRSGRKGTK